MPFAPVARCNLGLNGYAQSITDIAAGIEERLDFKPEALIVTKQLTLRRHEETHRTSTRLELLFDLVIVIEGRRLTQ